MIAATAGPGLIGGLLVGLTFAKTLAQVNNIPFIGVNHLEGHALTARLTNNIDYPFLLLLVSGGHTNFYFIEGINKYFYLGGTLDDAIGEAYDKVANILELGFPGGPNIEKLAKKGNGSLIPLPKPLIQINNLDLSFSGLKTAVLNIVKNRPKNHIFSLADVAASFQKSISDILCKKITIAINIMNEKKVNYNNVVIAGGVAANKYLRKNLYTEVEKNNKKLFLPPVNLCTDNGAMIAWAGYELYQSGIRSNMDFKASPRWAIRRNEGEKMKNNILVLGAGAWGTAIANLLAENIKEDVLIWGYEKKVVDEINNLSTNNIFLPKVKLNKNLIATNSYIGKKANIIFIVVPSQYVNNIIKEYIVTLSSKDSSRLSLVICSKGFDLKRGKLLSQVLEVYCPLSKIAILSGPSFAKLVANKKPTAITIASKNKHLANKISALLHNNYFRVYVNNDIISVQINGALKNVLAIAAGLTEGLGYGENARAAIISRGLVEIEKISIALGGKKGSVLGLSGIGDILINMHL